jgi:hypothetical protein
MKRKKFSESTILEDGSRASTGHKPKAKTVLEPEKPKATISIAPSKEVSRQIKLDRKVESYAYKIRQEVRKLSALTDEISTAYAAYAESNERIDSSPSIHNGLGNMMKLIEVQTTTKLRIKKMQTAIMQAIAQDTPDEELPYAMQDIMREVNVNFLDSKLVRAYGEIAKVMKEDLELAKTQGNEIKFVNNRLGSELEDMPTIEVDPNDSKLTSNHNVEDEDDEIET